MMPRKKSNKILNNCNYFLSDNVQNKHIYFNEMIMNLFSDINTAISGISAGLIVFFTYLFVGAIMIGLILFIYVLEHRLEIRILRAIGQTLKLSNVYSK